MDMHYNLTNPASVPDPTKQPLRRSTDKARSSGHHMASPSASPIGARPLSSTPYQQPQASAAGAQQDADVSTGETCCLRSVLEMSHPTCILFYIKNTNIVFQHFKCELKMIHILTCKPKPYTSTYI